MKLRACIVILSLLVSVRYTAHAQTSTDSNAVASQVPRVLTYSGVAKDDSGNPMAGELAITFSLYQSEEGGSPMWAETQKVQADSDGHFSAQLGSVTPGGVPLALFSSTEVHWIGTRISGQPEAARVLLLSVPYALKAADAETLGGLPASAFVQANPVAANSGTATSPAGTASTTHGTNLAFNTVTGLGTANYIPVWRTTTSIGSSVLYQTGGNVGIGTTTPAARLDTSGTGTAVSGTTTGTTGVGVIGQATSTTGLATGVQGFTASSTNGATGVFGEATATTGNIFGVSGFTTTPTSFSAGVLGVEGSASGQVFGVDGTAYSTSTFAAGVAGYEAATTGAVFGTSGETNSVTNGAAGVDGFEGATSGVVYGVSGGTNSSTNGAAAVNGYEGALTGQVSGVLGSTISTGTYAAGVTGNENSTSGFVYGVFGSASSVTDGAAGVNGFEGATTGQVYGVNGSTNSTGNSSAGLNGYEGATTGQVWGVNGSTNSTTQGAAGVNGFEGATTGIVFGVVGGTNSTTNGAAGVAGSANATTGPVTGVSGSTNSSTGGANGVFGAANATTGGTFGVQGVSSSTQGVGVQGSSPNVGVAGFNQVCGSSGCNVVVGTAGEFVTATGGTVLSGLNGTTSAQVFRVDSSGNGFFAGNLNVTGAVSKGSGSFKIDDPLDPANRYLSHSFVESPDMMNVYNGNVTTDKRGLATVVLPEYFQALNRDFRYQLTVIGQFAQAIVAREIRNNRFMIRTNKPSVKVSWQVTGIRQDAYANAHRIPNEEEKPAQERGHYLHPDLFGATEREAIGAVPVHTATMPDTNAGNRP